MIVKKCFKNLQPYFAAKVFQSSYDRDKNVGIDPHIDRLHQEAESIGH